MSKEFLTDIVVSVATVTSKGQVTLPASVRERLGLREGSRIVFLEAGQEVRVLREEDLERSFAVFDRRRRELRLTRPRMRALLDAARDRLRKEPRARRD
jgi:AbrB family looped-hinge helix DNA binding protein